MLRCLRDRGAAGLWQTTPYLCPQQIWLRGQSGTVAGVQPARRARLSRQWCSPGPAPLLTSEPRALPGHLSGPCTPLRKETSANPPGSCRAGTGTAASPKLQQQHPSCWEGRKSGLHLSGGGKIKKKKNPEGSGGSERAMRNARAQGIVFAAGAVITPGSGALSLPTRCPAEHVPRRLQARGDVICAPPASASQKSRPRLGAVRCPGSARHAPADRKSVV